VTTVDTAPTHHAHAWDHAPLGIAVTDSTGRFLDVNPTLCRVLGRTRDELIGLHYLDLTHPRDREATRTVAATLGADGPQPSYHHRGRFLRGDDSEVWTDIWVAPVRDASGRAQSYVVHVMDATALVNERGRARDAMEAERAHGEFLSRMSHELRTPLNSVLGFAQLLEMDELRDDQRDAVAQIMRAGSHLRDLLTDVLEYERAQSGRMVFSMEPVAAERVLGDALGIVGALAHDHDVTISAAPDSTTWVTADHARLRQVLLNLVTNAVKYNRPGGRVDTTIRRDGDDVVIEVRDTGRGIETKNLPLLFTPFERLGAETTGVDGAGVGLPLARSLAEGMGGRMEVHSDPGVGSTFSVRLGAAAGPGAIATPRDDSGARARLRRRAVVLYVDDNDANVALLEQMLERRGMVRVMSAATAADGLVLAQRVRPDVVLLDLHLPDGNGRDVLEALRADTETEHIPVVIVSADATPARMRELLEAGAAAYVTKPIVIDELFQAIDDALVV
jgi:PAS domain S-box-containing protein